MEGLIKRTLNTDSAEQTGAVFGVLDRNIKELENAFGVAVRSEDSEETAGNTLIVEGRDEESVGRAATALEYLCRMVSPGEGINDQSLHYVIDMVKEGKEDELSGFSSECICVTTRGKPVKAKTAGQKRYVGAIRDNTIVFGVGPAGTGKTYLAVALAVDALRKKTVSKIILTRPAVEAGERLGYLPGDLQSKIDPYLRPLYDSLYDMLGSETCMKYIERGTIEVAPLAYMRGRTLSDSFIILDEAQNTTREQMKMFLTRLGFNSKIIVTGDITQTDLPEGKQSGLAEALRILRGIEGINLHYFTEKDVVRHRLVQRIITAYEKGTAGN
ncbi:MAG: PhoH family protein [Clostridia bacterium]|nr:PhoH family protein [Clostridia bacterium]